MIDKDGTYAIAWKCIIIEAECGKIGSLGSIAENIGIGTKLEYKCFLRDLMNGIKGGLVEFSENDYDLPNDPLSEERRNEIAWLILVEVKYEVGISLGKEASRNIEGEATRLGVTVSDAKKFTRALAQAILDRSFK